MTTINDFATTYMCQSLPFGGVKESGFDRFAGIEGLRGLCVPKARGWGGGGRACKRAGDARCPRPRPRAPLGARPPLLILLSSQAVAEDRWPFSTAIPPLLQYPVR